MKKHVKKIFALFFVSIMFFAKINNVYASVLAINNVASEFSQTTIIKEFASLGSIITSQVDSTNKTLDIYSEGEKLFSFNYGADFIEYNNRSTVVTEENYSEDFFTAFWIYSIIESVLRLSGYENKTISEEGNYTNTYDTYGIQLESESYSFSGTDEDSGTWSASGDYIKYFKISLNTDKIDALMAKYGVNVEEQEPEVAIDPNLVPTIEVDNITENSATLYAHVSNYTNTDSEQSLFCYIYRSDTENGTYEKISESAVNCLFPVGITDEGLKSNTTYYYKAMVDGGIKFSDTIAVTTKGASTSTNTNTNNPAIEDDPTIPENPQTGSFLSTTIIVLAAVVVVVIIYFVKRKNRFYKI